MSSRPRLLLPLALAGAFVLLFDSPLVYPFRLFVVFLHEVGHAVVAVGYDDKRKVRNRERGVPESVGAFLIRNSWGEGWGEQGYGWLPYDYVRAGLAEDWWTLLKAEWVDSGAFGL